MEAPLPSPRPRPKSPGLARIDSEELCPIRTANEMNRLPQKTFWAPLYTAIYPAVLSSNDGISPQGGSNVTAGGPQRAPAPNAGASILRHTSGWTPSTPPHVSGNGLDHPPAFQLCTAKVPADRWQVFELWPTHKLHVLEAEVIRPSDKYPAGGEDLLSILAVCNNCMHGVPAPPSLMGSIPPQPRVGPPLHFPGHIHRPTTGWSSASAGMEALS